MLHAARLPLRILARQSGGRVLMAGPARSGALLEIVVKQAGDEEEPEIIHADYLRPNLYNRLLRGDDVSDIDEVDHWIDAVAADDATQSDDPAALREIGAALYEVELAQHLLRAAVAVAHENGHSWTDIAIVLGVSRQAARQRFADAQPLTEAELRHLLRERDARVQAVRVARGLAGFSGEHLVELYEKQTH